jgi:hypothetical protein
MDDPPGGQARLFTLEEARALLPELRRLLAQHAGARASAEEVVLLLREMEARRTRANTLELARPLRERREQLGEQIERLQTIEQAILAIGVEVKRLKPALIDFPSIRDGRVVYLCWREDEETITHWHDLDAGYAGRTPL